MFTDVGNIVIAGGDGTIAEFKFDKFLQPQKMYALQLDAPITLLKCIIQSSQAQSNSNSSTQKLRWIASTNLGKLYEVSIEHGACQAILEGHNQSIKQLAFGKHNHIFATITHYGVLTLWDLSNYRILAQQNHSRNANCITFADNEDILIGLDDGIIIAWKLEKLNSHQNSHHLKVLKKQWQMVNVHKGKVTSISLRDSKKLMFTGGDDGIFRIWNYQFRTIMGQFHLMMGPILSIVADNEKTEIFHILGSERQLVSFNMKRDNVTIRRMIESKHSDYSMTCMSLIQSNIGEKELYCVTNNGNIIIWDPQINDMISEINVSNFLGARQSYNLTCCALSHNSKYLCAGSATGHVIVVNVSKHSNYSNKNNKNDVNDSITLVGYFQYHGNVVTSCSWTPDDKQIISSSRDGSVCVWNFYT